MFENLERKKILERMSIFKKLRFLSNWVRASVCVCVCLNALTALVQYSLHKWTCSTGSSYNEGRIAACKWYFTVRSYISKPKLIIFILSKVSVYIFQNWISVWEKKLNLKNLILPFVDVQKANFSTLPYYNNPDICAILYR